MVTDIEINKLTSARLAYSINKTLLRPVKTVIRILLGDNGYWGLVIVTLPNGQCSFFSAMIAVSVFCVFAG